MTTQKDALIIKDVTIAYDGTAVVHDASLTIKQGDIYGLVGLNGAGKTTLIKTILGLREPEQGTITLFGRNNQERGARDEIVYLPERFDPPWFLTGLEFVNFSLKLYHVPANKDEIYAAAEKLALDTDALKRRVQTYSKGMRQKLGLIATLLTKRRFVILDEPMSGLDPMARALVKDMLTDMKADDQTILICSHILSDLDEMCPAMALIHKGEICFTGKPAALKTQTSADNLERAFLQFIEQRKAA